MKSIIKPIMKSIMTSQMKNPAMTRVPTMKNAQKILKKTAQIRQKRNATADRAILTPLPGLATVTPTP
ncbi:TPA: hypothetical protein H4H64_005179 [Escherichia coli]|nr:hypothetical protein [Escherichia coli]MBA0942146.1 hypothetical protein [Escherichia coli]HAH5440604.1 hypothetical protein [Escherichia coli]HAL1026989.1 hypothetical protein [Escherichia coli]HDK2458330.1 hypothetical protein [Escherichia coli]